MSFNHLFEVLMYLEIGIKPRGSMGKIQASVNDAILWRSSQGLKGIENKFVARDVVVKSVLKSWRASLFAHEWLDESGKIKPLHSMKENEKEKRENVLRDFKQGNAIEKAVLGIGLSDNVEIGSGRAIFLTLAAEGYKILPVHVPSSCLEEFADYLA